MASLDAYAKPPQAIKDEFKRHQKVNSSALKKSLEPAAIGDIECISGLSFYPSFLSTEKQISLLNSIFHRDLLDPIHQTNIHTHYDVPYPPDGQSYFAETSANLIFEPKHSACHKPFSAAQYLQKKLRWMTLGGQYDWTNKVYPPEAPPAFPADIKHIVEAAFPMKAEAAIVNLYSPGDTLSMHRDVSEHCDRPLVSISIGCECLFTVGIEDDTGEIKVTTLRLRSGDAVLMSGRSRYAWHGVPKVIAGTCPTWLQDWPGKDYDHWRGWMNGKRINLNVRQMFDDKTD